MRPLLTTPPIHDAAEIARVRDEVAARLDGVGEAQRSLVTLVVSELVTNALLHAGGAGGVRVLADDGSLRIEVDDDAPADPARRTPGPSDVSGRGLQIVGRICERWGVEHHGSAKTVWCELQPARLPVS